MATILATENGLPVTTSNPLPVSATLNVGDIEIGAVEIKDGTTDTRAVVSAEGLKVDTELPAAALLASASAVPTTSQVGAILQASNGTTIDLLQVDASKNLKSGLRSSAGVEPGIASYIDGESASTSGLQTSSRSALYNGTTWDRQRSINGSLGVPVTPLSGKTSVAITSATTTAVKASAGVVGTISNGGNAITGVITVYDSLSAAGKIIWAGTMAAGQVLPLGIPCGTGITVVTTAADTIVVSFA